MVYNVKEYDELDFNKLYLINLLLSNPSSDILFNNLRKKNNLVYSCGSSIIIRNGILIIRAMTSKSNIHLAKLIIKNTITALKNMDKYSENINNILERLEMNLLREKDNFYAEPGDIINYFYKSDISSEEILNELRKISKKDLLDCIERLYLKCVYTLEGEE